METAIRLASPNGQEQQRFILLDIVNNGFSLNSVISKAAGRIQYERVSAQSKLPQFAAFDWSRASPQLVAFGHVSGSASLIRLQPGVDTSETIATYRVKQQRRCNSIAFSADNWLAVALDKTRADLCLSIYDAASTSLEPVRRLCPAELVSSVRFFAKQPQQVLVGAQRAFMRLYDLRDGFAGSSGNVQVATRHCNNIAIDPTEEMYFAAGGSTDDASITVWDKRWLSQSVTTIDNAATLTIKAATTASVRTSVWSIRFSGHRRGQLAMCSSTGELRVINVASNQVSSILKQDTSYSAGANGQSWQGSYIQSTRTLQNPFTDERRAHPASQRVVSFDWIHSDTPSVMVLRANKTIEELSCSPPPLVAVSALNSFTIVDKQIAILRPTSAREPTDSESISPLDKAPDTANESPITRLGDFLATNSLQYLRCKQGYSLDCRRNATIVVDDPSLVQMWSTIEQLQSMAEKDGMVYDSADLAYIGIHGIWSEVFGNSPQRRLSPSPTKPSDAISGLIDSRELPSFDGERTNFAEHRQLCLAVCGWKFTVDALEEECLELIERGLHYQAVIQAVLHGAKHLALNLLRSQIRTKAIANIGLGALLAADNLNDEQREMTRWMAADTDDTALKALLAYLESGDWRDVMKTPYLNLAYRIALGLKYLNDTELNSFIQSETARAIMNGDPEGILLTGLTEQSMDLFQRYITRTGDIETAVLASAFTNPLYVDDARWIMWKESYFLQMQAWRAFTERTRFIIEHNRLSKTREGRCLEEPVTTQARLHCVHCRAEIRRPPRQGAAKTTNLPEANAGVVCHQCNKHLPRCSVCTLWLGTPDPHRYKPAVRAVASTSLSDKMVVFCTKCGHGSHAGHAQEWFTKFTVCPSPGCDCGCSNEVSSSGYTLADLFKRM